MYHTLLQQKMFQESAGHGEGSSWGGLGLSVARALIYDPDVLVMNAENMPRGSWMLQCIRAVCAWQRGGAPGKLRVGRCCRLFIGNFGWCE